MSTVKLPPSWREAFGVDYLEGFVGDVHMVSTAFARHGEETTRSTGVNPGYGVTFDGRAVKDIEELLEILAAKGVTGEEAKAMFGQMTDPKRTNVEDYKEDSSGTSWRDALTAGAAVGGALIGGVPGVAIGVGMGALGKGIQTVAGAVNSDSEDTGTVPEEGAEQDPNAPNPEAVDPNAPVPGEGTSDILQDPAVKALLEGIGFDPNSILGGVPVEDKFGPIFGQVRPDAEIYRRVAAQPYVGGPWNMTEDKKAKVVDLEREIFQMERGRGNALEKRQLQMFAAGLFGDVSFDQIEWGQPDIYTVQAWQDTLVRAARETYAGSRKTVQTILEEMSSMGHVRQQVMEDADEESRDPIEIESAEDLRMAIEASFRRTGRKPSAQEQQLIINSYVEAKRNTARQVRSETDPRLRAAEALMGGERFGDEMGGDEAEVVYAAPSIQATTNEFIDENLEGQVDKRSAIGYYDQFQAMLRGG